MKVKLLPGFTLVELLVAISLVGILSGIGITSFINFRQNQIVNQAASQIVQDLRLTQSMALNGQKPTGCSQLQGYFFKLDLSGRTYKIYAECTGGCPSGCSEGNPAKSDKVSDKLTLSGFTLVEFKVLNRGIVTTGGSKLDVTGFTKKKTVTIDQSGGTISL